MPFIRSLFRFLLLRHRLASLLTTLSTALLLVGPLPTLAASGSFTADSACEATTNKADRPDKPKKNPDNTRLSAGQSYTVIDASADASWLRIVIPSAQPAQRWVPASCGNARLGMPAGGGQTSASCSTGGQADSYVFAVSWQAAFCATHQQKPECTTPTAWAAGNFTLHGLWPNKTSCGTNYGFCSSQPQQKNFCAYPEPAISPDTFQQLGQVMPSAAAGSCLQRHEWYKHGTCQSTWDANGYFQTAITLTQQFNASGPAAFMRANLGKQVRASDFYTAIDQGLGNNAHQRMKFTCTNGQLVDIYINLPATIPSQPDLRQLIGAAKPGFSSNCGNSFTVDSAGR